MTPSRVRHVLVFLGASATVAILTHSSVSLRADDNPASRWIETDSVRVTNARFSPNGDAVQDSVSFTLSFTQASSILVYVSPAGLPDTVAIIVDSIPDPRVAFRFAWDGYGTDGMVQAEGDYTVSMRGFVPPVPPEPPDSTGIVLSDSTLFFIQRQVRIDVTAPTIEILRVTPPEYAPDTQHVGVIPEIHVRLSQSQLEDLVDVEIRDAADRIRQSLPLSGGFSGDGDYVALCEDCAFPTFTDGVYVISATASDVAGNHSPPATSTLDKNIEGPTFSILRPSGSDNRDPLGRYHFQFADSLVGSAGDRQVVDSVVVAIPFPPDTTRILMARRDSMASSTYNFNQDLSQLLAAERVYEMTLTAWDAAGVSDDRGLGIVVDRTRPAPPLITPRPPPATKLETLQFTVTVNDTAIREVIIQGGAGNTDVLDVRGRPQFSWFRVLNPGPNLMSFEALDYARNVSVADTMTVVWETSQGLVAPERFEAGHNIQVDVGATPAQRVRVRILALDGSLVRTFDDATARLVYTFPWDLTTPEGRPVKNGAYLLWVQVRYPDGRETLFRKMIAAVR